MDFESYAAFPCYIGIDKTHDAPHNNYQRSKKNEEESWTELRPGDHVAWTRDRIFHYATVEEVRPTNYPEVLRKNMNVMLPIQDEILSDVKQPFLDELIQKRDTFSSTRNADGILTLLDEILSDVKQPFLDELIGKRDTSSSNRNADGILFLLQSFEDDIIRDFKKPFRDKLIGKRDTFSSTRNAAKVKPRDNAVTKAESSNMTDVTLTTTKRKTRRKVDKTIEKKSKRTERKAKGGSKMMWYQSVIIFRLLQFFLFMGLQTRAVSASFSCAENQVAELGKRGTIVCSFPDNFHAVHWYDDAGDGRPPLVSYTHQTEAKKDCCLENESYDVCEDGSLFVCNVTVWHERNYTVVMYRDLDLFEQLTVSLTVVAYPGNRSVVVECDTWYGGLCHSAQGTGALTCSFSGARPPVEIEWVERFPQGNHFATTQDFAITNNSNGTYNSSAKVHLGSNGGKKIAVLVCVATYHSISAEWRREHEILLDVSQSESFSGVPNTTYYMETNRRAEMQCGDSDHMFLIWKSISSVGEPETIGFKFDNVIRMTKPITGLTMNSAGNLVFSSPQIRHEGQYVCVYSDGEHDKIQKTTAILLIAPSPPYIKIKGCDDAENTCVLEEETTQELTCTVDGVYPMATLEWISKAPSLITLYQPKRVIKNIGQLHGVASSVNYSVSEHLLCEDEIYIECRVQGPISRIIKADRVVKLTPERCTMKKGDCDCPRTSWLHFAVGMLLSVVVSNCMMFILIAYIRNDRGKRKKGILETKEELTELNIKFDKVEVTAEKQALRHYFTI